MDDWKIQRCQGHTTRTWPTESNDWDSLGVTEIDQINIFSTLKKKERCVKNYVGMSTGVGIVQDLVTLLRFHRRGFPVLATRHNLTSDFPILWLLKSLPGLLQHCSSLRWRSVISVGLRTLPSVAHCILTRCVLR